MIRDKMQFRRFEKFIEMLSIEISYSYFDELKLEIPIELNHSILKLARACLEVYFYPQIGNPIMEGYEWHFPKYWKIYRNEDGILSNKELNEFVDKYINLIKPYKSGNDDLLILNVFNDLESWVGIESSIKLNKWYKKYFYGPWNEYLGIKLILLRLAYKNYKRFNLLSEIPLCDNQINIVNEITIAFDMKIKDLSEKFRNITFELSKQKATHWEAVVQTFPVDNSVNGKCLPRNIETSLKYQIYENQIHEIKMALGNQNFESFLSWVNKEIEINKDWI
jgi:hypothetical protein